MRPLVFIGLLFSLSFVPMAVAQDAKMELSSLISCSAFQARVQKIVPYLSSHGESDIKTLFYDSIRSRSETGILTIKNNPEPAIPGGRYVMTQSIWADVLDTTTIPRLVPQFDALRYSPFFTENADLIIYMDEGTNANLAKVERLLRVTSAMKLRIHVVWLGNSLEESDMFRLGRILAVSSGGRMVLLDKNLSCTNG